MKLLAATEEQRYFPNLVNLNVRQTSLTNQTVNQLIAKFPNLRRLNLSFTGICNSIFVPSVTTSKLEKLSLTSTAISSPQLVRVLSLLPDLKTLAIGAIGGGPIMGASMFSTSLGFLDDHLRQVTDVLDKCAMLENVSLVGNAKLGTVRRVDRALAYFVKKVGRRCKVCVGILLCITAGFIFRNRSSIWPGFLPYGLRI